MGIEAIQALALARARIADQKSLSSAENETKTAPVKGSKEKDVKKSSWDLFQLSSPYAAVNCGAQGIALALQKVSSK